MLEKFYACLMKDFAWQESRFNGNAFSIENFRQKWVEIFAPGVDR